MTDAQPTASEAAAALAAASATRASLAHLTDCPPWRHAAFGLVMGLLVTGIGLPQPWQVATMVVSMAGVIWLKKWDERRYGVFVNGYRRGKTLPLTVALTAALLALIVIQVRLRAAGAPLPTAFAIGCAAFLVATSASVLWSRIFRREMERAA
ncbi:hypothetical protein [Tsuneonella sp. HG222]